MSTYMRARREQTEDAQNVGKMHENRDNVFRINIVCRVSQTGRAGIRYCCSRRKRGRVVRQKQVRYKPLEQRRALIGGLVGEGLSACLGLAGDGSASVGFQWASSAG